MQLFPLKSRPFGSGDELVSNAAGDVLLTRKAALGLAERAYEEPALGVALRQEGFAYEEKGDLYHLSYLRRLAERQAYPGPLSYLILVPTLRCNLSCAYCQVSRVAESARGFDWTSDTLASVIGFLGTLSTSAVKIEFQGGEPLLRLDLLQAVYRFCIERFEQAEFVVCTNLQHLTAEALAFLRNRNVFVSTSLEGALNTHSRNRTRHVAATHVFFENLYRVINELGSERVSALPTVDPADPPDPEELLSAYRRFGFRSIYLRPINYQGFARKKFHGSARLIEEWNQYYDRFINYLIEYNWREQSNIEEYYFSLCLSRILRPGVDGHVDLRNPNWLGTDYVVIDHDGAIYPTDEARMLARIGLMDLTIGDVRSGLDKDKIELLNRYASNETREECRSCVYQAYCGVDLIDDISRYGRIDHPKLDTWFCRRHMAVFDKVFELLSTDDPKVRHSLEGWAAGKLPRLARLPP